MNTIIDYWSILETLFEKRNLPEDKLEEIDRLVCSDGREDIQNGLTLIAEMAPEYLCRYVQLNDESMVLRESRQFSDPASVELYLVRIIKTATLWKGLYDRGVFDTMEFRALGSLPLDELSDREKDCCIQMTKGLVLVSAGECMVGNNHVSLTNPFLVGEYVVTQALWEHVMGSNPSHFKGANRPVENVSWFDAIDFCNALSEYEGLEPVYTVVDSTVDCNWDANGYRLPTEAEWSMQLGAEKIVSMQEIKT